MESAYNPRCKTLTDDELSKDTLHNTKLDDHYRLEWGQGSSYTIWDDENTDKKVTRHRDRVIGVLPLKKSQSQFISVGLDNQIQVIANNGRSLGSLKGHQDRILGVQELDNGDLLSASADGTLRFWNPSKCKELAVIDATVDSIDAVKLNFNQSILFLTEQSALSIWTFKGEKVAELCGQTKPLEVVHSLSSGRWLTRSMDEPACLWSATGDLLNRLHIGFSFEDGYIELSDGRLITQHSAGGLSLWSAEGSLISEHAHSETLAKAFSELVKSKNQAIAHKRNYPTVEHYSHARNPLAIPGSLFKASREIKKQELELPEGSEQKAIWDFFNRPLFTPIKTALKDEIRGANSAESEVVGLKDKSLKNLAYSKKLREKNKLLSIVSFTLLLPVAGYLGLSQYSTDVLNFISGMDNANEAQASLVWVIAASVLLIVSMTFFLYQLQEKKAQITEEANLDVLNALIPCFSGLVNDIKLYRRGLLASVPVVKNPAVLSGLRVAEAIDDVINGKLLEMALNECGIEKEDIVFSQHESIILKDWSLIQGEEKRQDIKHKLNSANEFSFWMATNGTILFAVQYVQYIFLTADKIDVFTTYYDFVAGKCITKEANAFYYKDVTNIAKREVDRKASFIEKQDDGISATEISLTASSGEKICLTILNEESVSSIADTALDHEEQSLEMVLEELQAQKQELLDGELDEDERQEELEFIEGQIADAQRGSVTKDALQINSKADDAIMNIRAQIRLHKQDANETLPQL